MPSRNTALPGLVRLIVLALAALAVLLWLLPLFTPRHVLFPPGPNYPDIDVYLGRFSLFHKRAFFTSRAFSGFAYPPGAAVVYAAFYSCISALKTFRNLSVLTVAAALLGLWIYLRRKRLSAYLPVLLLFSFPLVFLLQRANIELILWILITFALIAYRRGAATLAAILIGLAAAIKLYPILLLGLFLTHRQHLRAFLVGMATAVLGLIAATAFTGPTFLIAAQGFTTGLDHFQNHYVDTVSSVEIAFDHSLFSPIKYWAFTHHTSLAPWRSIYYLVAGAFALLLFLRVRKLPSLNRIVFLSAAMVCLPPVSFSYTLVHLYLPILFLLAALAASRFSPPATAILALTLLLTLTLPLNSLSALQPIPAGPLQSLLLIAILLVSTLAPWPESSGRPSFQP